MRRPALLTAGLCLLLAGCHDQPQVNGAPARAAFTGDPARGKAAMEKRGCIACHAIPGIANPGSNVGPPLDKMARRAYIAGVLPNTPADMVRWLRDPPAVDPQTAMPAMGIGETEAKDMAAYLATLD